MLQTKHFKRMLVIQQSILEKNYWQVPVLYDIIIPS